MILTDAAMPGTALVRNSASAPAFSFPRARIEAMDESTRSARVTAMLLAPQAGVVWRRDFICFSLSCVDALAQVGQRESIGTCPALSQFVVRGPRYHSSGNSHLLRSHAEEGHEIGEAMVRCAIAVA